MSANACRCRLGLGEKSQASVQPFGRNQSFQNTKKISEVTFPDIDAVPSFDYLCFSVQFYNIRSGLNACISQIIQPVTAFVWL